MAATFEKDDQLRRYINIRSHYLIPMMASTFMAIFSSFLWLSWDKHSLSPLASHIHYLLQVLQGHKNISGYITAISSHSLVFPISWRLTVAALLGISVAIIIGRPWFARPDRLKGLFVLDGVQVHDHPKPALEALKRNERNGTKHGITIYHGIGGSYRLPFELETKHMLYLGSVGTGKTATMLHSIHALIARGDSAVIYDYKGDFTEWLGGRDNVHLIAFADTRSEQWHIAKDIDSPLLARELAQTVIQETSDPIWSNNARDVLTGTIEYLIASKPNIWGFKDLSTLLSGEQQTLAGKLHSIQHGAAYLIDKPMGDKTASSIMSTVRAGSWIFDILSEVWGNPTEGFSIRDWLRTGKGIYILRNYPAYSAVSNWLLGIIFNQIFGEVLNLNDDKDRRIWAVIDELATLPSIPRLQECLVTSRSKGFRFICGIQNFSSMRDTYGADVATTLFSQFATKIVCRVSDADTAKMLAGSMGGIRRVKRAEVKRIKELADNGDSIYRWKAEWHDTEEATMLDSDIMNLPDPTQAKKVVAWLAISGYPIAKLHWNFLDIEPTAKRDFPVIIKQKTLLPPVVSSPVSLPVADIDDGFEETDDFEELEDIDVPELDEPDEC